MNECGQTELVNCHACGKDSWVDCHEPADDHTALGHIGECEHCLAEVSW